MSSIIQRGGGGGGGGVGIFAETIDTDVSTVNQNQYYDIELTSYTKYLWCYTLALNAANLIGVALVI